MAASIVSIGDDIFFWSQIHDAAHRAGCHATRVADEAALGQAVETAGVTLILVDLGFRGIDSIAWASRLKASARPPLLVGYGSHVDVDLHDRARAAGFDLVLPKSQFAGQLGRIIGAAGTENAGS